MNSETEEPALANSRALIPPPASPAPGLSWDGVSAYCDGGVIGRNPSALGGTWAWCWVNPAGEMTRSASGVITIEQARLHGLAAVTNNLTELLAAVEALDQLPDGWRGTLYTDSLVTLRRVDPGNQSPTWNAVPEWLQIRVQGLHARLGKFTVRLLGGHPTKKDLRLGFRPDGKPVSRHNVWCDEACGREAEKFRKKLQGAA